MAVIAPRDGHEPDYRFTLANERTYLAWLRTSVAVAAGGFALIHVAAGPGSAGLGTAFLVVAALVPPLAYRRWRRVQEAMRHDQPLPANHLASALGAVVVVAVLGLVVLRWS